MIFIYHINLKYVFLWVFLIIKTDIKVQLIPLGHAYI